VYSHHAGYKNFCKVLQQEGLECQISYDAVAQDFIEKYPNRRKERVNNIPLIQHFVYAFGADEPRVIGDYKIQKMVRAIKKLNAANHAWQHYIWTNDVRGIPDSLRRLSNVIIKDIQELNTNVLYLDITRLTRSRNLVDLVQSSDLIRIAVLQRYGGIYFDCDVEVFRPDELEKLMQSFDVVLGEEPYGYKVGNAIMAAAPNHPVMNNAVQLILRNLHQDEFQNLPQYLRDSKNNHDKIVIETGPTMITVAYYKFENLARFQGIKTKSILLPKVMLYNMQLARKQLPIRDGCEPFFWGTNLDYGDYQGIRVYSIAADPLCGTWGIF